MGAYVAVFATLAGANGLGLAEKVDKDSTAVAARVGDNTFETIHLPYVP